MFMGPLRETKVWSTRSVDGVHRFLGRVWRLYEAHASPGNEAPTEEQLRVLHSTIKRVTGAHCRASHAAILR
jgi:leucyl-tRNA synthetase